jgi:hypothetical protein
MMSSAQRVVYCEDALKWLESRTPLKGASFIASMPDVSEFPSLTLSQWKDWFVHAASLILSRCDDDGVAIFYQTDIKVQGEWIDKAYLCQKAAEQTGHALIWHKVACRAEPGKITFGRPSYSHLICFSKNIRMNLERSTADVLPEAGETTWTRGMGVQACIAACRFILSHTETRTVIDPFCGHGTALAVANEMGLNAIGIEMSAKRAKKARTLQAPGFKLIKDTARSSPDSQRHKPNSNEA